VEKDGKSYRRVNIPKKKKNPLSRGNPPTKNWGEPLHPRRPKPSDNLFSQNPPGGGGQTGGLVSDQVRHPGVNFWLTSKKKALRAKESQFSPTFSDGGKGRAQTVIDKKKRPPVCRNNSKGSQSTERESGKGILQKGKTLPGRAKKKVLGRMPWGEDSGRQTNLLFSWGKNLGLGGGRTKRWITTAPPQTPKNLI